MSDHDALLRTIVEYPFDLRTRLVYADFLDENVRDVECLSCGGCGHTSAYCTTGGCNGCCDSCNGTGKVPNGFGERAEFIRLMCDGHDTPHDLWKKVYPLGDSPFHPRTEDGINVGKDDWFRSEVYPAVEWTQLPHGFVRNGLVQEILCEWAWWVGGECPCFTNEPDAGCDACHGTGRTPANGPMVVAKHPVTRVVVLEVPGEESLLWDRSSEGEKEEWVLAGRYYGQPCPHDVWMEFSDPDKGWPYPTREAAVEALSRALVDWARKRAGLTPIQWEVSQ